jgi:hypothetical protein
MRWDGTGRARKETYMTIGLAIRNGIRCLGVLVAGYEVETDECWAKGFDHQLVVVEGCDDDAGIDAIERCGDVGGRHYDRTVISLFARSRKLVMATIFEATGCVALC